MPEFDFSLVKGNLLPKLQATLQDELGVIDLTGATVVFKFQGATVDFSGSVTVLSPATAGNVEYAWTAGQTDVVGEYRARFVVTQAGKTESFPNTGFIRFYIHEEVPVTAPAGVTLIEDLYEPVRAILGDHDEPFMHEDLSIARVVRSLLKMGEIGGYTVTPDRNGISPAMTAPKDIALLVYKACRAFAYQNAGSYSFRTRALSERFGENKDMLWHLEQSLHGMEHGAMFNSLQSFYSWMNGIAGLNVWAHLTDMKVSAPVGTLTVGRDGVQVSVA